MILQDYELNDEQNRLLLEKKNVISNFFNKYSYLFDMNRIYKKLYRFDTSEEERE